jgi:beta-barrel assembly-enhancing protease
MRRIRFILVVTLLIAGAALATRGTPDPVVSLDSFNELWADTLRDTDQIGMKATRVDYPEEMRIGAELAQHVGDMRAEDPVQTRLVNSVGQAIVRHASRRGIEYHFHIIQSAEINAFALPGGQIFVTSGMLNFVQSPSELAAILGHEISHVDLRHCIERYQYEAALKKAGMPEVGEMVEIAHHLATFSFSQYQEADADAQGERMAIQAGYDPHAAAALFRRMMEDSGEGGRTAATTPGGEVAQAVSGALASFFRSHPTSEDRIRRIENVAASAR